MGWLSRYRHSKGFGIHSPFAYRFVTEVLEERLPYYDYVHLPDEVSRLLYRVACRFTPKAVCTLGSDATAVHMACPEAADTTADACDMLVATPMAEASQISVAISNHAVVFISDRLDGAHRGGLRSAKSRILSIMDAVGYGMSFYNERDTLILVPNPKLPRQHFNVKF